MQEVKITFGDTFPDELKTRILAYVENCRWLFPKWCQEVLVCWDAANINGCLKTNVYYEYRYFKITVTPLFLGQGEEVEQEQMYHEILHGQTSYLADFCREILDTFCDHDGTRKILSNALIQRNEAITQDLAYAISNKFKNG